MSTILKALKKLEQENRERRQPAQGQLPYMGPGSAAAGRHRFAAPAYRRWARYGLAAGLIALMGGAAAYLFAPSRPAQPPGPIQTAGRDPSTTANAPSAGITGAENPSAAAIETPRPAGDGPRAPDARQPPVRRAGQSARVTRRDAAENPDRWQPLKALTRKSPEPAGQAQKEDTPPTAKTETTELPPGQVTAAAPKESATPASGSMYDDIPPLTDGRLKVQALAWSPIAQDRMAVINTRIVHEGDKVDGFAVLAIRNDDVIVREKGVTYRVDFGRP